MQSVLLNISPPPPNTSPPPQPPPPPSSRWKWTTTVQGEEAEEGEEACTALKAMILTVSEGNKYKAALVQVVE